MSVPLPPDSHSAPRCGSRRIQTVWILYWLVLFAAMHTPKDRLPNIDISRTDKLIHFTGYAILASLCALTATRRGVVLNRRWYTQWFLILIAYAGADELLQPYVNRTADWADWVADLVGVTTVFAFIALCERPRRP